MRTDGLNGDTRGAENLLILPNFDCCLIWRTNKTKEEMVDRRVASDAEGCWYSQLNFLGYDAPRRQRGWLPGYDAPERIGLIPSIWRTKTDQWLLHIIERKLRITLKVPKIIIKKYFISLINDLYIIGKAYKRLEYKRLLKHINYQLIKTGKTWPKTLIWPKS